MRIQGYAKSSWEDKMSALYLWSIRRQGMISSGVLTYVCSVVATLLLMSLLVPLKLGITLQIILFGGLMVCGLLWVFVERRRSWLLTIRDPALKEEAHRAMIAYLRKRIGVSPSCGCDSKDDSMCTVC
jgi:hypothetical protein